MFSGKMTLGVHLAKLRAIGMFVLYIILGDKVSFLEKG